jgi:hypothetical protein
MQTRIGAIAFDCADTAALADFYAGLFEVEAGFRSPGFSACKVDGVWLAMHLVEDYRPPSWPGQEAPAQVHLDVAVDDVDATVERALALGATRAGAQPSPDRWTVLLDPAGHPFCVSPASSFPS